MAKCDYCGSTILFGGVKANGEIFCNAKCQEGGAATTAARDLPPELIAEQTRALHQGACPKCKGPGPVDVHTSHSVMSFLVMTVWNSHPEVSCRTCGVKSKLLRMLQCGTLGWWGFPYGLIITPVQLSRNLIGLFWTPDPQQPSKQLQKLMLVHLGDRLKDVRSRREDLSFEDEAAEA